ncbi:P-loop containing nucleoside triphosphate hydrolase protein [Trichophaea hybrida]|nr:P-loop containing nucleoside triphosphate hydrolase protein [Trichophaea hybrida]
MSQSHQHRRRTTEDLLRHRQLIGVNHPAKRNLTIPTSEAKRQRNDEILRAAPDWRGDETTPWKSTPGPYDNLPSSIPPRPLTAAVERDHSNTLSLSHRKWGLSEDAVAGLRKGGLNEMYPWQSACLSLPGVLEGEHNVVYTAPTSAGKSLVADVLMIKRVLDERRKALVVVPYISIVQEKTRFLEKCLTGIKVEVAAGKAKKWRDDIDITVCTIEKANTLVNAAVEDRTIDDLGLVVLDELHMVDDDGRGFILEILAAKLLSLGQRVQIVGMSATLSNIETVGKWLNAQVYECTYRPIPLSEHIVYDSAVYTHSHNLETTIPPSETKELKDPITNAIITLALEAADQNFGVLVFCESRRRCEDLSLLLRIFMVAASDELQPKRFNVLGDLATTATGIDPVLAKTVPAGVAFHHAGLTTEERDIITAAYNNGLVKVVFCTATMAAGVNLPARRVIISPKMGRDFASAAILRQMRGRAGRKGKDTHGETYIVCRKEEVAAVDQLLTQELPSVKSTLVTATDHARLSRALLEVISTRLATSIETIRDFLASTLLHYTHPTPTTELLTSTLTDLESQGHITPVISGYYEPTKMGQATVTAGFTPADGLFLHQELSRALQAFNLETDLHICYIFTPLYSLSLDIDWKHLRDLLESLDEPSLRAALFCGVNPAFVNRLAQGTTTFHEHDEAEKERGRIHRRFYVSLMLRRLINETPVHKVAREFGIARGFVQSLATTCRGFAATTATFCKVVGWTGLAVLVEHYSWRLDLGAGEELVNLARLPWVKSATARCFWENGLRSIETVAETEVERLKEVLVMALPGRVRGRDREVMMKRLRGRAEVVSKAAKRMWEAEVRDIEEE